MEAEAAVTTVGEYQDPDESVEGTGTYVVMGIFHEEDDLDITVAYGPFDTPDAASKYGTRNYTFSWVCEIVNTDTSTPASIVDPNQATIADYIDPSVVE